MFIFDAQLQQVSILLDQKRYDMALDLCHRFLSENPQSTEGLILRARALQGLKKYVEATESIDSAILQEPDNSYAHFYAASIWRDRGHHDKSLESINQALELDSSVSYFHCFKGLLHADKNEWQKSLKCYDQALEIDPDFDECLTLRSLTLTQLGNRQEAAQTSQEAMRRDPESAFNHANEGYRLLFQGKYEQSRVHLKEALRLDPNNEFARSAALESLRATNPFYRVVFWYFHYMNRLTGRNQIALLVLLFIAYQYIVRIHFENIYAQFFMNLVIMLYIVFALSTWFMQPLSDSILRFSRFGNLLLSAKDKWRSTAFMLLFVVGMYAWMSAQYVSGYHMIYLTSLCVSFPLMLAFNMQAKWTTWCMIVPVVLILGLGVQNYFTEQSLASTMKLKPDSDPQVLLTQIIAQDQILEHYRYNISIMQILMIGSQIVGMSLMQIKEKY